MTEKPLLLLVDDDAAFRTVMATELSRSGYDVRTAGSGEEALSACADADPQVILLDLQMPDVSGLDVLKRLREREAPGEVIMLTGHGSIDTAIEAIRIGAFDYVSKPCPLDELEIRIGRALERLALKARATLLERGLTPPDLGGAFLGESPEFRGLLQLLGRVAQADSTAAAVEAIVDLTKTVAETNAAMMDLLRVQYDIETTGNALGDFAVLGSDAFVREVKKRRPKKGPAISPSVLKELRALFEAEAPRSLEKRSLILMREREISAAVHAAYGLTPEDLALLRATEPPRMPWGW